MEPKKSHVVCFPAPAQGHINPMFKLAKLLHCRGSYITFVHTEFNFDRLAKSLGSQSPFFQGHHTFRFETIPDGLPSDNKRGILDLPELCRSFQGEPKNVFRSLLKRLIASSDTPPVTCILLDAHMNFMFDLGKELGIRVSLFYTTSACSVLGFLHFSELVERGLFPLKDESCLSNGFLDTPVDWIPGLIKGAKLKHLPSFIRTTDPQDLMFNLNVESARIAITTGSIILNTFDDLDDEVLEGIKTKIPNLCTVGPLSLLCQQADVQELKSSLWKEDANCLAWLDERSPKSVIYVNYGSLTTLTQEQLGEFAWGLANSKHPFLWVIRDDLVNGESSIFTKEYMEGIKERGLLAGWCPQEKVLKHPSITVFLTHCGWNSTSESISEGVPLICWPFFADQQTSCLYACYKWGIGMQIGEGDVKRENVERVVIDMMEGEIGKEIREKGIVWKQRAEKATRPGGSSYNNFDNLVRWLLEDHHG